MDKVDEEYYLKIRDDIDLKELKKFGFKYRKSIECWQKESKDKHMVELVSYYVTKEREFQINTYDADCTLDGVVYDLITTGILEKVKLTKIEE